MLASDAGLVVGVVLGAAVAVGVVGTLFFRAMQIVQQGSVGVVKRLGEFRGIRQPGLHPLVPFMDRMAKVDMREFPMTGDQQSVITADNVSLRVSATIFCQVIDVKAALFEIADYQLAVDQLSRTALRAVFGELTLDQSLSERDTINLRMQDHMADAAMKWGVRLNRIEILDITPPSKRAAILKSEGEQQAAINSAGGRKQAAILEAEGGKLAAILAAEAQMRVLELQAEGAKKARTLNGEGEAAALAAIDEVAIRPNTLAVMQLRALQDVASAPNSKIVVPYEAAGLVGAAQVLVDALKPGASPDGSIAAVANGSTTPPPAGPRSAR
jgi:regulator of protease activity HflC (stomatin/prohibitin superfamily)